MALSQEGADAVRRFNRTAAAAVAASMGVHAAQFVWAWNPRLLFAFNVVALVLIAWSAFRADRATAGGFDSAVGAETVVAFGVMSLILGLVTAVVPVLALDPARLRFDRETLTALAGPFIQGLAAAGLAPMFAVLLRNVATPGDGGGSTADDFLQLSRAAGRLAGELGQAKAAAAELSRAVSDAAGATAKLGPELAAHLDGVATATGRIAPVVGAGATALADALDQGGRMLADELDQAGKRFATRLDDARAGVDALAAAAADGAGDVGAAAAELARLRAGAAETTRMLDALGALIDSADRFVSDRQARP